MNDLIAFLNTHASCRRFTDDPVTPEQEETIITTAQRSPTSSNLQAYSIVGVRDSQKKKKLAALSGNQDHVERASLFLVFCADLYRLRRLNEQRGYPFHGGDTELFIVATVDAALAASRALMAAQAMDLGGVMVGGIRNNPEQVCALIGLPDLVYPVMGMSLGYPAARPKTKPRLPLEGIYFREAYSGAALDSAVEAYDRTIDEVGYLRGRETEPDRYPDFDGTYSWSEHSARRLASDNPKTRRTHMLPFLRERGFLQE